MCMSWDPNSPRLLPTIVCYADILGFRDMTERAFKLNKEREFLQRIKRSLSKAYEQVRGLSTLGGAEPFLDMKVFTDNIVVASPLRDSSRDLGEPELGSLLMLFGHVQSSLAADGFFLRGAITAGHHYQDQDIAYGDALLEAASLNETGKPPRLVIGSSLEPMISEHLSWYGDKLWAPHYRRLLEDPDDKKLFVNYLGIAFAYYPDGPTNYRLLAAHRKAVRKGLREHESNPSVRSKYVWLATYHNFVCRTFTEEFPNYGYEWDDSEEMTIRLEAQRGLDYILPFEANPDVQTPLPLQAQRLRERLTSN